MPAPGNSLEERTDDYLAAILCGGADAPKAEIAARVPARALHHGVQGLLMARTEVMAALPGPVAQAIRDEARGGMMWELGHRRTLAPLLDAMATAGVRLAVLKGTALAYSLYDAPSQRPRGDTDLLVRPQDLDLARRVLADHGFRRASDHEAERMPQEEWETLDDSGTRHLIDLHWNLLRPWALSGLFDTGLLLADTTPLPRLCIGARALSVPMALLHACVHRASHVTGAYFVGGEVQFGGDRLIWYHDMKLLAAAMDDADWTALVTHARATECADLCRDALDRARTLLAAPVPERVLAELAAGPGGGAAARYFIESSLPARILADMKSLPAGESRLAFLRELVLPPAAVMRGAYPDSPDTPLVLLHLRRLRERLRRARLQRKGRG